MWLSCLPVSFFREIIAGRMSVAEWARIGAEAGLDAIDLSIHFVPDRSLATATALRRDVEAAGMRVAMLTTYPDFTHPNAEQRQGELERAKEAVSLAAELDADLMRVTAGQAHPETGREQGIIWAVDGLTRLTEASRGSGVTLVYENHAKPSAWRYTDFSQPPDIFLEIVRRTAGTDLGINFDTANATAFAQDPLDLLAKALPRVVSVHAADTSMRNTLQPVLLGTGVVPFPALFGSLKKARFDGWICIEEASGQGVGAVLAAARFVRQAWAMV